MADDHDPQNPEPSDGELLRRYTAGRDEEAFAALVRRHLDLVYAVALRKVAGDAHLAEDVAQRAFGDLAAKAALLQSQPVLSGWLFTATHYAAAQVVRAERRRRERERKAHAMNELLPESEPAIEWERLRPLLDDLVLELPERDREAVLLRYFEAKSFAEVGERLQLTDEGARARVDRAVEKLHGLLMRRGITSTSAALGLALANHASGVAPAGLMASVTGAALGAVNAGTVAVGAIGFMSTAKIVTGIAAVVTVAAIGIGVAQYAQRRATDQALAALKMEKEVLAARMARAEEHAKDAEARAQLAKEEGTPSKETSEGVKPVSQISIAAQPAAVPAQSWTLDTTKQTLASVVSRVGKVNLDDADVANIRAWVKQDPEGLVRWIAALPTPRQREHATEAVISLEKETDPELAFILANSIEDERPRGNRLSDVIKVWAPRDPDAAERAIAKADLPENVRQRLLLHVELARKAAR